MKLRVLAALALASITLGTLPASADDRPTVPDVASIPAYPYPWQTQNAQGFRGADAANRRGRHHVSRGARRGSPRGSLRESGPGVVRSSKTGATARVAPGNRAKFQAYVDDLERNYGATVRFMGGYRRGPCSLASQHPCGGALDVCQLRRGIVDARCHLPSRRVMVKVARAHGLYEGGSWCNSDRGHAQVRESAGPCRGNLYAAVDRFKKKRRVSSLTRGAAR